MDKKKYRKFFCHFERVVCSWSLITTEEENNPLSFCLKSGKKETNTSLSFFLTWSKQNARKVYTWLPLYFLLVFHFSIFLWQKVFKQVLFSCVKVLNDMLGMNQGTNSKFQYTIFANNNVKTNMKRQI